MSALFTIIRKEYEMPKKKKTRLTELASDSPDKIKNALRKVRKQKKGKR